MNATARWFADGINNASVAHNGTGTLVNYTVAGSFGGNWTNYTLNFANYTQFPRAGNVTVVAVYAEDLYGQLNGTSPAHFFSLWGTANLSGISMSASSILNQTNATVYCNVSDANSTAVLSGYNVSFWNNLTFLGSGLTNSSGIANFVYADNTTIQNMTTQALNISCNITAQAGLFYNQTSVFSRSLMLNVTAAQAINISSNHSVYNRGENITIVLLDTNNQTIQNVSWTVNLAKFNQTNMTAISSGFANSVTFPVNSSDPAGNYTLVINATISGRNINLTKYYNVSSILTLNFTQPAASSSFSASAAIDPRPQVQILNARNEVFNHTAGTLNITLGCPNGNYVLEKSGTVYENTSSSGCLASSTAGTSFSLTSNASDTNNNTGTGSLSLQTSSPPAGGGSGGGGGGGGGVRVVEQPANCTCTDWTTVECGAGGCGQEQLYQTRICTPAACAPEYQCINSPSCVGVRDFNITARNFIELRQGEGGNIILTTENTGDIDLNINISVNSTCCSVGQPEGFKFLAKEVKDATIPVHSPLTQNTGTYLITIDVISLTVTKTKTVEVYVIPNPLIAKIGELKASLASISQKIDEYVNAGVGISGLVEARDQVVEALSEAERSIQEDNLAGLQSKLGFSEERIGLITGSLEALQAQKFFAENKWYMISGIILTLVILYLASQIMIPFYKLGREISLLTLEEQNLVKSRVEAEKQYFTRKIDEKTFNAIMITGQEKILKSRASLKQKQEIRAVLIKSKLSPLSFLKWLATPVAFIKR